MNAIETTKVRLKVSGQSVDPRGLPESLVMIIAKTFDDIQDDPYAILATYAYIFCGLKINEIKDMIILSDRSGTRKSSREYIRQKIVTTFHKIQSNYLEEYGSHGSVSPVFQDRNIDPIDVAGLEDRYKDLFEEDFGNDNEGSEEKEAAICKAQDKVKAKEKAKDKPGSSTKGSTGSGCDGHRPGNSSSWLVRIKSIFGRRRDS